MPFYFYDKDGNQFKTNHAVDRNAAIKTGKYFINPPGATVEEVAEEEIKPIEIEGIEPIEEKEAETNWKEMEGKIPEEKKPVIKMKRGGN